MANWQQNLKRIFANHKKKESSTGESSQIQGGTMTDPVAPTVLHLDDKALVQLMHCLEMTHEGMCTCAEAFAMLDEYTELVASDEQSQQLMPLVKNHMDMCPDCREEFEILLNILQVEKSESLHTDG